LHRGQQQGNNCLEVSVKKLDVSIGSPCVIGENGVESVIDWRFAPDFPTNRQTDNLVTKPERR